MYKTSRCYKRPPSELYRGLVFTHQFFAQESTLASINLSASVYRKYLAELGTESKFLQIAESITGLKCAQCLQDKIFSENESFRYKSLRVGLLKCLLKTAVVPGIFLPLRIKPKLRNQESSSDCFEKFPMKQISEGQNNGSRETYELQTSKLEFLGL